MTFARYAKRTDASQKAIVDALRRAGWDGWVIGEPCDLLCWKASRGFRTLECKTPFKKDGSPRKRKDQHKQDEFIALTGTRRACTPFEALLALGETVDL